MWDLLISTSDDLERKSPEWEQCMHAAQWIPRAYDMYCNLEEVIQVCLIVKQGESIAGNSDEDGKDNEDMNRILGAYEKILTCSISAYMHFFYLISANHGLN